MKKKILAIMDEEAGYVRQMGAYLSENGFSSFQIITFTVLDSFLQYCSDGNEGLLWNADANGKKQITILLIGEKSYGALLERKNPSAYFVTEGSLSLPAEKIMILQEMGELLPEQLQMNGRQLEYVYKYQSMDSLCREVMERFARDEECRGVMTGSRNRTQIIGFYTPGGDIWNSVAAMALGQILAEKEKVFYLNLQLYGSLGEWFGETGEPEGDLSDLLYFVRNQREKLLYKLEGMKRELRGMEYLHPIPFAEDLQGIPAEEWLDFLHNLCYASDYSVLVLDLSDGVDGLTEMLKECDALYTVGREDVLSGMKQKRFREWCARREEAELAEAFRQVCVSDTWSVPDRAGALLQHPIAAEVRRVAVSGGGEGVITL